MLTFPVTLVTTTMDIDTGIARKLPPMPEEDQQEDDSQINARNIYVVLINSNDQLLVEGEMMDISQLREGAKRFIDNNGAREDLSENPEKAIISLKNDRETDYKVYISVQNELVAAYNQLRDREFTKIYPNERMSFVEANKKYSDPRTAPKVKAALKPKLDVIKQMFPQKLSEAEPNKS